MWRISLERHSGRWTRPTGELIPDGGLGCKELAAILRDHDAAFVSTPVITMAYEYGFADQSHLTAL